MVEERSSDSRWPGLMYLPAQGSRGLLLAVEYSICWRRRGSEGMSPEMTPGKVEELKARTLEASRQRLPCAHCGSTGEPVLAAPRRGTSDWWDDPSVYVGCSSCGAHLAGLPSIHPYVWRAEALFG